MQYDGAIDDRRFGFWVWWSVTCITSIIPKNQIILTVSIAIFLILRLNSILLSLQSSQVQHDISSLSSFSPPPLSLHNPIQIPSIDHPPLTHHLRQTNSPSLTFLANLTNINQPPPISPFKPPTPPNTSTFTLPQSKNTPLDTQARGKIEIVPPSISHPRDMRRGRGVGVS